MAISGTISFLETVPEFLAHWASANAAAGGPVVLPDGLDLTQAGALLTAWDALRVELVHWENDMEGASGQLKEVRGMLVDRMQELRGTVGMFWRGQALQGVLPVAPGEGAAVAGWSRAWRDGLRVWALANAGPPPPGMTLPLVLGGGFTLAQGEDLLARLESLRDTGEVAELRSRVARAGRDLLQARLRRMMAQYRMIVPMQFGAESSLARELPRLSPLPGHTPERPQASLTVSGEPPVWQITWQAMEGGDLKCWQIRRSPGPRYLKNRERVVATLTPDAPREWTLPETEKTPGFYRVYALLETGNERGSRTLHAG